MTRSGVSSSRLLALRAACGAPAATLPSPAARAPPPPCAPKGFLFGALGVYEEQYSP